MNWHNSKIYMIYSDIGSLYYIGSTKNKYLSEKIGVYKKTYYKNPKKLPKVKILFDTYKPENCKIKVLEYYPCDNET